MKKKVKVRVVSIVIAGLFRLKVMAICILFESQRNHEA